MASVYSEASSFPSNQYSISKSMTKFKMFLFNLGLLIHPDLIELHTEQKMMDMPDTYLNLAKSFKKYMRSLRDEELDQVAHKFV